MRLQIVTNARVDSAGNEFTTQTKLRSLVSKVEGEDPRKIENLFKFASLLVWDLKCAAIKKQKEK